MRVLCLATLKGAGAAAAHRRRPLIIGPLVAGTLWGGPMLVRVLVALLVLLVLLLRMKGRSYAEGHGRASGARGRLAPDTRGCLHRGPRTGTLGYTLGAPGTPVLQNPCEWLCRLRLADTRGL